MGFGVGILSKVKSFFCSPVKEQTAKRANLLDDSDLRGKIVNSGLGFGVKDFGSKDDMFFDSRAWLDSDCDDDFYSVNGEFTPRGSTPNRQIGILKTPQRNGKSVYDDLLPETKSETSSTDSKKKLAELLQDSSGQAGIHPRKKGSNVQGVENPDIGMNEEPYIHTIEISRSQNSSEGNLKPKKGRKTTVCCMPSLVPSVSSMKPKMSPAR